MFDRAEIDAMCDRLQRYMRLRMGDTGLSWPADKERILANSKALSSDEFQPLACELSMPTKESAFSPLYYCIDDGEVCGAWTEGEPTLLTATVSLANLITAELCMPAEEALPLCTGFSYQTAVHYFSNCVIDVVDPILRIALAGVSKRFARYEWDPIDGERYEPPHDKPFTAPLSHDDDFLAESGFRWCAETDEHASPVWASDFEPVDGEFNDMILDRALAALKVLRGEQLS